MYLQREVKFSLELLKTNPSTGRGENLSPGTPTYKVSALSLRHAEARLPPPPQEYRTKSKTPRCFTFIMNQAFQ